MVCSLLTDRQLVAKQGEHSAVSWRDSLFLRLCFFTYPSSWIHWIAEDLKTPCHGGVKAIWAYLWWTVLDSPSTSLALAQSNQCIICPLSSLPLLSVQALLKQTMNKWLKSQSKWIKRLINLCLWSETLPSIREYPKFFKVLTRNFLGWARIRYAKHGFK